MKDKIKIELSARELDVLRTALGNQLEAPYILSDGRDKVLRRLDARVTLIARGLTAAE